MKQGFNLSAWALKQQQLMAFLMLLIMATGIISYEQLSRNEDPAFTIKTAVVSAQWPGANLSDTVNLVTDTLEKKLQEIPWLDYVQSETHAGRCVIFINLRDSTPPDQVADIWYQVRKKMQDTAPSLPQGVQGPVVNDEFEDTFGTIYGFTADGFTMRELRDRVDSIRRDLMSLPDVGKIQLLGEQEEQLVVAFSHASCPPWVWIYNRSPMRCARRMWSNLRVPPARPVTMLPCASAELSVAKRVCVR